MTDDKTASRRAHILSFMPPDQRPAARLLFEALDKRAPPEPAERPQVTITKAAPVKRRKQLPPRS